MVEERRKRPHDEDSDEEIPLPKSEQKRELGEDLEPKRPRSTRRCAQNRKPITEEPTDSEEEVEEEEEVAEEDEEEEEEEGEEDAEEEYDSDDFQADHAVAEEDE